VTGQTDAGGPPPESRPRRPAGIEKVPLRRACETADSFSGAAVGHSPVRVDELQQRVTFRFGAAADIRCLRGLPKVGDFVTHDDGLWVVERVETDSLGALVICENPGEPGRAEAVSEDQARRGTATL
jgi:hypothetical protein